MISLVRLVGAPVHEHAPTRLRVLIAELGMGVDASESPAPFEEERIDTFAEHAAVYQPDLLIALDAPFGGPFLGDASPSEEIAVTLDRYYRVEARTNIPRRRPASVPVSPASGGALVLSEYPLSVALFEIPVARPLAPFYFTPFAVDVVVGAPEPFSVLIRDGLAPDDARDGLQVIRGVGSCDGQATGGQFPICLQAPGSWELLRHDIVDDFAGLGLRAIKAEFRLRESGPIVPE